MSPPLGGILLVDKPAGMTSHDVVAQLRRILSERRIGHAGTLDPDATGLLVAGVGRATRLLQFLSGLDKEYRGTVAFGVTTDTLDAAGQILDRHAMPDLTAGDVMTAVASFAGLIEQVPPMVSAIKVAGVPLHVRARRGEEIERAPRPVTIHEIEVEDFVPGPYPEATLRLRCSSGTYVRTLAADLGRMLGGGAHLSRLRRLCVGPYAVEEAIGLEALAAAPEPWALVRPPTDALRGWPSAEVDAERARAVGHGAVFAGPSLTGTVVERPVAVLHGGELIAVYGPHPRGAKPIVVLGAAGNGAEAGT
jgi:tRNA pseudouridine55 synthase